MRGRRMVMVVAAAATISLLPPARAFPATKGGNAVPLPRVEAGIVYDDATGQVVLFGGLGRGPSGMLGDTWTWDGTDWTERTPAHAPGVRSRPGMAVDVARSDVVLFGGYQGGSTVLGDTWIWDGADWTERTPAHAPATRTSPGMADDV